jgi:hypothetical protein
VLDRDRGTQPSMVSFSEFDPAVSETAAAFQQFHGFDGGLSSIYRCLAQWPSCSTRSGRTSDR